jgi:hypothetical protein
VAKEAYEAN